LKRSEYGLNPKDVKFILNREVRENIAKNEAITLEKLK
jgi:sialic acid synthase SpsE